MAGRTAFGSVDELLAALRGEKYIAQRGLATAIYLALKLGRPSSWKARPASARPRSPRCWRGCSGAELIRLQCYEGLDVHQAVYEWNYARQMLHIRLLEARGERPAEAGALRPGVPAAPAAAAGDRGDQRRRRSVLLIDEIDRADEEFEAFLLEVLSDFQITIPEIGTLKAAARRRSSSSPRTARARSTTRSSGAASTTGSTTRRSRRSSRSCARRCPAPPRTLARAGGRVRAGAAPGRALQAARRRRDARLGRGARGARPAGARRPRWSTTRSA